MILKAYQKAFLSTITAIGVASLAGVATAAPLPEWDDTLPEAGNPLTSQEYQDFTVYSLNYLTNLAEQNPDATDPFNGLVKQQSYNYATTGGAIADDVVIMTAEVNAEAANNLDTCGGTADDSGCDNAYGYVGSSESFDVTNNDPEPSVVVVGEPTVSTWTAKQETLAAYLGDGDLTFLFNLNESNGGDENTLEGQSLLVSAKIDLTDSDGNVLVSFYLGANNAIMLPQTAEQVWASLGEPEADPANVDGLVAGDPGFPSTPADGSEDNEYYDPTMIVDTTSLDPSSRNGFIATDPRWAYVHGAISVDATTGAFLGMGNCAYYGLTSAECDTINQNLGRTDAAFAAVNLELSDLVKSGVYKDPATGVETAIAFMNVDLFTSGQSNGFEQVLIHATYIDRTVNVDEPGTLAIMALGLLAMGIRKRRFAAQRVNS
jgi:hypothetical protein